jgi:NAD(P)H-flavin reductase
MWRLHLRRFSSLKFESYKLQQRIDIAKNCRVLRFEGGLDMPLGDHLVVDFEDFTCEATPISTAADSTFFDLLLPLHKPTSPYAVRMSKLKPGQSLLFAKAKGSFNYLGRGAFEIRREDRVVHKYVKYLGMITEGEDIAQMLPIIHHAAFDPGECLNMSLVYSNATVHDILFKTELEELFTDRSLHLDFLLQSPPANWQMSSGELTAALLAETMPPVDTHSLVLVSRRLPQKEGVLQALETLGYPETAVQVY